jgi:RNA polymerase sigma-70 factor (ECF subfamily)
MDWKRLPADQLFVACAGLGEAEAWREFMRRYHNLLTVSAIRVARRWGKSTANEIDDIVQEIYLKVCAKDASILTRFRDSRPEAVFGYLKVIATNIAHDFCRRRNAQRRGLAQTVSLEGVAEQARTRDELENRLALEEIEVALRVHTQKTNGPRDRTVFRLHYHHGLTAKAIAGLPGINLNSKGVEAVLFRLKTAIRRDMGEVQEMGAE